MKKAYTPSKLFGLKQKDMAILLGVSVGQYSMYECGLRRLPRHASQLLDEMLLQFHAVKAPGKTRKLGNELEPAIQLELRKMLKENEYQQSATAKKIAVIEKKQASDRQLLELAEVFVKSEMKQMVKIPAATNVVSSKAAKVMNNDHGVQLVKLEMRLETLKFQETWIKWKLKHTEKSDL